MTIGDFLGGGNALKVDTDVILAKADEVESKVNDMKTQLAEVERMINESANHWHGEAGDMHRSIYAGKKEEIDRMVNDLAQHPVNLREAVKIYMGIVTENTNVQNGLPTDVIS